MAPTFVLLHGFTHTGASWRSVLAALGERYPARCPDIRGHGSASALRPVTLEAVCQDVSTLCEQCEQRDQGEQRRFTLVGYSMGGRIALHVALAMPTRVERLVLIGASPGIADPEERAARRAADEELAERIEHSTIAEFATRWAAAPVLAGQTAAVRSAAHADRLRNTPAGLAAALRGLGAGALPSLWDRLDGLTMPVTLIVGERDQKFKALAHEMAAAIAQAAVEVVPGAGHAVHLELPEAVARYMVAARDQGKVVSSSATIGNDRA